MTRATSISSKSLLLLMALFFSGCGSSRQLQSVTVTPSTADAKNFPSGQVQFVATGIYVGSPSPVILTSNDIQWCYGGTVSGANTPPGICAGNIAQFALVDQNGLAQCTSTSFQGSVYILAGTSSGAMNPDVGPQLKVFGSAQLTCP